MLGSENHANKSRKSPIDLRIQLDELHVLQNCANARVVHLNTLQHRDSCTSSHRHTHLSSAQYIPSTTTSTLSFATNPINSLTPPVSISVFPRFYSCHSIRNAIPARLETTKTRYTHHVKGPAHERCALCKCGVLSLFAIQRNLMRNYVHAWVVHAVKLRCVMLIRLIG